MSDTHSLGSRFPDHLEAPLASADSDSWDPPDPVKGDVARAVSNMAIRYTGDHTNEPTLLPIAWTGQITSSTHLMGRLSTHLQRNRAEPGGRAQRARNDRVCEHWQHNRNPFIDHPEWVELAVAPALRLSTLNSHPPTFVLSWPAEFTGAVPERTTSFPAVWLPVTNAATFTSTNWFRLIPSTARPTFYHLRLL